MLKNSSSLLGLISQLLSHYFFKILNTKLRSLDHTRELVKNFPNFMLGSEEGVTLLDIELGRILDAVSRFPVEGESRLTAQEKDYQIRPDWRIETDTFNDKQSQTAEQKTGDGRGPGDHSSEAG